MRSAPAPVLGAAPPAGRADARRNRELVLRTAVRVFAEDGLEVSLGRIAQRAGVGAGTVYRHFPSKEILLEAVLAEHIESLAAAAGGWAARAAPGDALLGFLLEVIEKSACRQHVCDALGADRSWPRALVAAAAKRFAAALDQLLRDAKQAGAIRADVQAGDLAAIAAGGAALCAARGDRDRGLRLARLLLDGLRPPRTPGDRGHPAVTKSAPFRDAPGLPGRETAGRGARYCAECGTRLPVRATGRLPRYCGPTCRQRARRRRIAS
jgi:AcrR family transcriptional regulator